MNSKATNEPPQLIQCPFCNLRVSGFATFCPGCGETLPLRSGEVAPDLFRVTNATHTRPLGPVLSSSEVSVEEGGFEHLPDQNPENRSLSRETRALIELVPGQRLPTLPALQAPEEGNPSGDRIDDDLFERLEVHLPASNITSQHTKALLEEAARNDAKTIQIPTDGLFDPPPPQTSTDNPVSVLVSDDNDLLSETEHSHTVPLSALTPPEDPPSDTTQESNLVLSSGPTIPSDPPLFESVFEQMDAAASSSPSTASSQTEPDPTNQDSPPTQPPSNPPPKASVAGTALEPTPEPEPSPEPAKPWLKALVAFLVLVLVATIAGAVVVTQVKSVRTWVRSAVYGASSAPKKKTKKKRKKRSKAKKKTSSK